MNITALTLRDLEYVVAVGDLQHFGKAAAFCHISQPTLSAQIKKVEELLGVQVFERNNRSVRVTPRGHEILMEARSVLAAAKRLVEVAQSKRGLLEGRVRIGAIATLGPYFWPYVLSAIRMKFKQLELYIVEGLTDVLIEKLKSNELDLVIASPTFDESGLRSIKLFFEPFLLALPKGHALESIVHIQPKNLDAEAMLLLEDGHCLTDQTLEICPSRTRKRAHHLKNYHATSIETLKHLVGSGLGYTLLPALSINEQDRMKDLISYRRFQSNQSVGRDIALYCRESFVRQKDAEALAEFLKAQMPQDVVQVE